MQKRKFSNMKLSEMMPLIETDHFTKWSLDLPPRPPSDHSQEALRRLDAFDTVGTEAAKLLLVDALLAEIIPNYAKLKIWKGEALESATLTGFADYLITPSYAYMKTPLLCAAEAKRDDFTKGRAQCLAELVACREKNQAEGYDLDLFGFVSNGRRWLFYQLTTTNEIYETTGYRKYAASSGRIGLCVRRMCKAGSSVDLTSIP